MKTKYKATFSDGEIKTRNSASAYTHAWRHVRPIGNGKYSSIYGFATSKERAIQAARSCCPIYGYSMLSSNEKAKARREHEEWLKTVKIEIVELSQEA